MLEKYRPLIYKSSEEREKIEKECWDNVIKSYPAELKIDEDAKK